MALRWGVEVLQAGRRRGVLVDAKGGTVNKGLRNSAKQDLADFLRVIHDYFVIDSEIIAYRAESHLISHFAYDPRHTYARRYDFEETYNRLAKEYGIETIDDIVKGLVDKSRFVSCSVCNGQGKVKK
jgi:hypothetical protein